MTTYYMIVVASKPGWVTVKVCEDTTHKVVAQMDCLDDIKNIQHTWQNLLQQLGSSAHTNTLERILRNVTDRISFRDKG